MTATLITTGIDQVLAEPLPPGGWSIRFRSLNTGLHHQLYANGRLVDWTDIPTQRSFLLEDQVAPVAVRVAAVPADYREADLAEELPAEDRTPPWVHRARLVRSIASRPGDVVEILSDHATGQLSDTPLTDAEIWPAWAPRWAFGEDRFGEGGFGYDGAEAPGMGLGAFGAGPLGMGADLIDLAVPLQPEGTHQLVVRVRASDGQVTDSQTQYVDANPPPAPAPSLNVSAYDLQTQILTLEI